MMKIYKLTSPNTDLVYVGKTVSPLNCRFDGHKSHYKMWLKGTHAYCSSYKIFECGEASIELIEEIEDREAFWINELNSCNNSRLNGGMTSAEKNKKYRDNNQDKVKARKKKRVNCPNCNLEMSYGSLWAHKKYNRCKSVIKN